MGGRGQPNVRGGGGGGSQPNVREVGGRGQPNVREVGGRGQLNDMCNQSWPTDQLLTPHTHRLENNKPARYV